MSEAAWNEERRTVCNQNDVPHHAGEGIIPGQLFAYYLARIRGGDPDKPRGLTKVTLTR